MIIYFFVALFVFQIVTLIRCTNKKQDKDWTFLLTIIVLSFAFVFVYFIYTIPTILQNYHNPDAVATLGMITLGTATYAFIGVIAGIAYLVMLIITLSLKKSSDKQRTAEEAEGEPEDEQGMTKKGRHLHRGHCGNIHISHHTECHIGRKS